MYKNRKSKKCISKLDRDLIVKIWRWSAINQREEYESLREGVGRKIPLYVCGPFNVVFGLPKPVAVDYSRYILWVGPK